MGTEETKEENTEDGDNDNETAAGGFFSAFSKIGISGISSSGTVENLAAAGAEDKDKTPTEEAAEDGDERKRDTWGNSLSNAFNKEQEDFIRTKSDKELPSAPWAGYNNEEELKNKILALSEDKRNVLRSTIRRQLRLR